MPDFVLRFRTTTDDIKPVRALLKIMWRRFGLRALEIKSDPTQETTMNTMFDNLYDLNNADAQRSTELVTAGVYRLRAKIIAGGDGPDNLLKRSKAGTLLMLNVEYTVDNGGDFHGRRIWDSINVLPDLSQFMTVDPERDKKLNTAAAIGRSRIRSMLESAYQIAPEDESEEARLKRRITNFRTLDGLVFWAQVEIRPARDGYKARNYIDYIVTPGMPDYPRAETPATLSHAISTDTARRDLDDEIPF